MKKILIDLDVLTVAFWDGKPESLAFLERVKRHEFDVYTPFVLFETLKNWKYERLKNEIANFYTVYSRKIISLQETAEKVDQMRLDIPKVLSDFSKQKIKDEDATLVLIASMFEIDTLVTFNRKHLRDKEHELNGVLKAYGLKEINVRLPTEI